MSSRFEELLTAMLNGEQVDIEPRSRMEQFLKNCCDKCGCDGLPTPRSRAEILLYQLAEQLAGGGDSGENKLVQALSKTITEVTEADLQGAIQITPYLFENCKSLTSITIPNSVTSIGDYACSGCESLTSITIPNSVITVGQRVFNAYATIKSVTILPKSLTSVGNRSFAGTTIESVYTDDISNWCKVNFLMYGNPLYYAENFFVNGELITNLEIPNGVTKIGGYAFHGYKKLASVTIPSSVTNIGSNAFGECTGVTSITVLTETPPTISSDTFKNVPATCPIYVLADYIDTFKSATNWSARADYIFAKEE